MLALTRTRDDLIRIAYPLIAIEARRFRNLPPGVSVDDLESVGNETLLVAATEYDGPEEGWKKWAKFYLRNRMQRFVTQARKRSSRHTTLGVITPDGDELPRRDPRTADPADLAVVRERLRPSTARRLPDPVSVAERVSQLQDAMFGALDPAKIGAAMINLQAQAASGDLRATKMLIELISPTRGPLTQQQAVIIHRGDLD